MADPPVHSSPLRAPVPTLEPDDAFLARLSSLAAAGAPVRESAAAPRATWRVGLAAASVAAVLVGVAWVAGLGQSDGSDPTPAPTTPASTPTSPRPTPTAATPTERPLPTTTAGPTSGPADVGPGEPVPSGGQPNPPESAGQSHHGNGPDAHAGNHPNEHATQKSANGRAGDHPGHGVGGRHPR